MSGSFSTASEGIGSGLSLLSGRWKAMLPGFIKVFLITMAISLVAQALGIAVEFLPQDSLITLIGALAVLGIMVMLEFVESAVGSVAYNMAHHAREGKDVGVLAQSKENFLPVVKATIVVFASLLAIALPGAVGLVIGDGLAFCALVLISGVLMMLFLFFTQFYMPEVVIAKAGHLDCLRNSFLKVRGNLLATVLFDIALIALLLLISIVVVGLLVAGIYLMEAIGFGSMVSLLLLGILAVLGVLLLVAVSIMLNMAITCLTYSFWKRISP